MQVELHITASAVAWYGAIVATTSLLVSGYAVWRDRAQVRVTAKGGWGVVGLGGGSTYPYDPNENYISITVINRGRRPVTITKVGFKWRWEKGGCVVTESLRSGGTELAEGKHYEFYLKESAVDANKIAYVFAYDATGKMYKGKFVRGDATLQRSQA